MHLSVLLLKKSVYSTLVFICLICSIENRVSVHVHVWLNVYIEMSENILLYFHMQCLVLFGQ